MTAPVRHHAPARPQRPVRAHMPRLHAARIIVGTRISTQTAGRTVATTSASQIMLVMHMQPPVIAHKRIARLAQVTIAPSDATRPSDHAGGHGGTSVMWGRFAERCAANAQIPRPIFGFNVSSLRVA